MSTLVNRKVLVALSTVVVMSLLVVGCGSSQKVTNTPVATVAPVTPVSIEMSATEKTRFIGYALLLSGGSFQTSAVIDSNKATVLYGTFDEAKKVHPESKATVADYNLYWSTGDAISKTLFEGPVRLLREFPELSSVAMKIPFEGKTYSVDIDRATAEKYFNVNLTEMHKDATNELWRQQIVTPYTSSKDQRAKYAAQFIKIS